MDSLDFPSSFTSPPPHSGYRASFAEYSQSHRQSQSSPPPLVSPLLPPTNDSSLSSSVLHILQPLQSSSSLLGSSESSVMPLSVPVSLSVPVPSLMPLSNPYPPTLSSTSTSSSPSSSSYEPTAKKRKMGLPSMDECTKEELMKESKEEIIEMLFRERNQWRDSGKLAKIVKMGQEMAALAASLNGQKETEGDEGEAEERQGPREVLAATHEMWRRERLLRMPTEEVVDTLLERDRELTEIKQKMIELERRLAKKETVNAEEREEEEEEDEEEEVGNPDIGECHGYSEIVHLGEVYAYYEDSRRFYQVFGATVNWNDGSCSSLPWENMHFDKPGRREALKKYVVSCTETGTVVTKKVQKALLKLKLPLKQWMKEGTTSRNKKKTEELEKEGEEEERKRREEQRKNKREGTQ